MKYLKNHGDIIVNAGGLIEWIGNSELDTRFNDIRNLASNHCLFELNGKCYIWQYPPEIFGLFKHVYIMTYLFDGSLLKYYFDMYNIQYETKSIKQDDNGKYILTDYFKPDKAGIESLITIFQDEKMDDFRQKQTAFSANWYNNAYKKHKEKLKKIKNNIYNFFHNKCKAKSNLTMWTTFKDTGKAKHYLKGLGYTNGFVANNCRATNDYADRKYLAYAVNVYVNPNIMHFFRQHGVEVDQDKYALSAMLQWIWRSAIRKGENICIYIPSKRMRTLLLQWLNETV